MVLFFLMLRRPPRSTRTDTLFPYTTLFRSQSLRPIPITAWLPFSIAMFGIKDYGAIFLICLGAFYPILISTTHGARSLDLNLLRAAQMMGARSEERRVGKECVSTCRSRWSPYH